MRVLASTLLLSLLLVTASARASTPPPDEMLTGLTAQMFELLRTEREAVREQPARLFTLVDEVLSPRVDFERMSRWVLGRYWRTATETQREQFVAAFHNLLLRFYVSALLKNPEELDALLAEGEGIITFQPLGEPMTSETVTVRAQANLPDGRKVAVHFNLHARDGEWKVFDLNVEGISLITTYRNTFGSEIRQLGLDRVIERLTERNHELMQFAESLNSEAIAASASHD